MECPKCHFDHPLQTSECLRCGVIFAKYVPQEKAPAETLVVEPLRTAEEIESDRAKARFELICRAIALPAALLFGWLVDWAMPTLAAFVQMWTHESGHALVGWLCGYPSLPTAWFTIAAPNRVPAASLLLGAAIAFGGYVAWRNERRFWVAMAGIALVLLVTGNLRTDFQAHGLIIFGGEAGSFVVATIMMATVYARPESTMVRNQVRWGLLVLGAIAFLHTYGTWAGGFEKIVHWLEDTDERGPSDLQQLTQYFGLAIGEMQLRFLRVAHFCFMVMAGMYVTGIVQARRRMAEIATERVQPPGSESASVGKG